MAKVKKSGKVKSQKKKNVKKKNTKKPLKKKGVKLSEARRQGVAASPRKRARSRLAQSTIKKFKEILITLKERISGDFHVTAQYRVVNRGNPEPKDIRAILPYQRGLKRAG